jgi:GAF domain-containing protein
MKRGGKSAKAEVEARPTVTRKPRRAEASAGRQFKQRLAEATEQHVAISEILRVISSSPGDVTPVLATVAERAAHLCDASFAQVLLVEGNVLRPTVAYWADAGSDQKYDDSRRVKRTWPLTRGFISGRAVLDCETIHHADVVPLLDSEYPDVPRAKQQELGYRAVLAVPLMREGGASGVIFIFRREPRAFSPEQIALVQTFARQAAIAIENVRLFDEAQARARELSVSLQQQTATADVLKVISRSAFDLQTVLDALTQSACKLCEADSATIWRPGGDGFRAAAMFGQSPEHKVAIKQVVVKPGRDSCAGRALLEGRTVHIHDAKADPEYRVPDVLNVAGNMAIIGVPLMHEGVPIGVFSLTRREARPFTENQIALATMFADQAVIAIENVRLFTEIREALERQTATSEILRVISQSPTDVQPVFDTIAAAALKLCSASSANVFTFDGELIHLVPLAKANPGYTEALRGMFPRPPGRDTAVGRAVLTRNVVTIPDVLDEPEYGITSAALAGGFRCAVGVPLLRDGVPIGAIAVGRPEPGPIPDKQITLLQTFADQAVIAIENVRLFNETREALERQTATSEILRVISRSPRDVQPVFDTIVKSAVRLCEARFGAVFRLDGGLVHLAAHHNLSETLLAQWFHKKTYPMPPNRGHVSGRTILAAAAVQVPDILADEEYRGAGIKTVGFRSLLGVPLLRGGRATGAIVIYRTEPGHFPDKHVELVNTFADQAVIAIENVRLFTELEARTAQLTRSVGELKALGEVGQAVSSTLDLETVLSTIVSRAVQLTSMDGGSIWEYDQADEQFYVRATDRLPEELVEVQRATLVRKGEGALGRVAITGEPVEIRDITNESSYQTRLREILIRHGYRSVVAVPLLREDHLLGALAVIRTTPGEFAPEVIALLKTLATQSALAIQNARLYREIEVKSKELEAASRHKSEFLANMSHELRTPLNAIIGFSEVLSERMFGEINEKQAEYIGDILHSGQHLLSLINDILDLSKIEAGRMELELSDFDVASTIENTLILVRERAQRRGITLGRAIDEQLGIIRADERKVKQVLLNLLSNALKFTPEGGRIDVQGAARDGSAEISVTDTGVGIAPEDQDRIFEEFRQVGTAYKKVEGTGLGLAISRKFIELHGGKIWVTSKVGSGSTFTFTLPLQRSNA